MKQKPFLDPIHHLLAHLLTRTVESSSEHPNQACAGSTGSSSEAKHIGWIDNNKKM